MQKSLVFLQKKGYRFQPDSTPYADNIYWVFGMVAPSETEQQRMVSRLNDHKIGTRPFFWCMHEQPVFNKTGLFQNKRFPEAEIVARNGFYIPSGLGLTPGDQERVIQEIKKHA